MTGTAKQILATKEPCRCGLLPEDQAKLDARYSNRQVPRFDSSPEGIENIALRCVKDYHSGGVAAALTNATSWIKRALEIGRSEQIQADREAVRAYFDKQADEVNMRMSKVRT